MNIISNNCVGGQLYQDLNLRYNNPFIWCFITGNDFITLIKKYNDINFKNIKILESVLDKDTHIYDNSFSIFIDKKIYVHYIHYIKDINYDIPTKKSDITGENNRDLLYKNADILCKENYIKRLPRMNESPIFIISQTKYFSNENIIKCMYLISDFKRIILIPDTFEYDVEKLNKNCEIIVYKESDNLIWTNQKSHYILQKSNLLKTLI